MERTRTNCQPHDRPYGLQRICTAVMTVGVGALLLSKSGLIPLPPWGAFFIMLGLIVFGNVLCWAWADRWLAQHLAGRAARVWRLVHGAFFAFAIGILGTVFAVGREFFDALPIALIMWVLSWNLIVFALAVILTAFGLARFLVGVFPRILKIRRVDTGSPVVAGCPADPPFGSDHCPKDQL